MITEKQFEELREKFQNNIGKTATYISRDFSKDKVNGERKEIKVKIIKVYPKFVIVRRTVAYRNGEPDKHYDVSVLFADLLIKHEVLRLE